MAFSLKNILSKSKLAKEAKKMTSVVGIDVGSSSIKVVELVPKDDYVMLQSYGELQLGPYAEKPLGSSVKLDQKQTVAALVDVMRESDIKATRGVLALPLAMSFVTIVPIPKSETGANLESRMQVEARKYIPIPLSEVILDWTVLPGYENGEEKESATDDVLIVAVQSESYKDIEETMGAVNLQSQPTEIELFCAQRAVGAPKKTQLVVDIGANILKVYLFDEGLVRKVHRVYCGGSQVTELYAEKMGIDFATAEDKKRDDAAAKDENLQAVVHDVYNRAFMEVAKVLRNFEQASGKTVELVTVTGGEALSPLVRAELQTALGREAVLSNGFAKVAYPAFMEDVLTEIAPSFSIALGAALRGVQQ